jgi:hypothetical protein
MTPELWEELSNVAQRDKDAIYDSYAWPPRGPLSAEELREARRLRAISQACWYRSLLARCT